MTQDDIRQIVNLSKRSIPAGQKLMEEYAEEFTKTLRVFSNESVTVFATPANCPFCMIQIGGNETFGDMTQFLTDLFKCLKENLIPNNSFTYIKGSKAYLIRPNIPQVWNPSLAEGHAYDYIYARLQNQIGTCLN